ncbi:MAG TPA: thermonuclease family protein [Devosia sp.]|nr:thermonuclease family protein [Devosia sp.]
MPPFRRSAAGLRGALLAALVLVAATLAGQLLRAPAAPITGQATAVDGDTLRLEGRRVRLLGVDAPELAQTCRGADGPEWPCGTAAQALMRQLLGRGATSCVPDGRDRYGRVLARCTTDGEDVAALMVKAGLAISAGGYLIEEQQARAGRAGIWAGDFMAPAAWRRSHGEQPPGPLSAFGRRLAALFGR